MVRRILFPTDFSDCAQQALPHAVHWARREGATLDVLYVVADDGKPPAEEFDALRARARHEIRHLLASHGAEDLAGLTRVVRAASPAQAIVDQAHEHRIDLVVIGTHGRTIAGTLFHGGVAEELVSEAPCPVLVVRQREEPMIPRAAERILVPLDFSPWAAAAVRCAGRLAARDGGTLVLLHVVEDVLVPDFYYEVSGAPAQKGAELDARAEAELERVFREAGSPDIPHECRTIRGRAAFDIPDFADRIGADLVVLPSHGLSARERLIVGSVTRSVMRRAPCPVLVLPATGRQPCGVESPADLAASQIL